MGQRITRITDSDSQRISEYTQFNLEEIHKLKDEFYNEYPSGHITKDDLHCLFRRFFPFGDTSSFASLVFGAVCTSSGLITFESLVNALSVITRGKFEEKIDWIFKVYDSKNDGYIDREELLNVIFAVYNVSKFTLCMPPDEDTPRKILNSLLSKVDPENTGKITAEMLKNSCRSDPTILEGIELFNNVV